jgi:hypothetical protein
MVYYYFNVNWQLESIRFFVDFLSTFHFMPIYSFDNETKSSLQILTYSSFTIQDTIDTV